MKKTRIEWVKNSDGTQGYTANPIRGKCLHNCHYCYAERNRIRFKRPVDMSWHPEVLDDIRRHKKPSTIFIGSSYDIFGKWVPDEYLNLIYQVADDCNQHRFIFLTKNAGREWDMSLPDNFWFGGTVTSVKDIKNGYEAGGQWADRKFFISCEPLLSMINAYSIWMRLDIKWIIIGALTRCGKPVPAERGGTRLEWVMPIIEMADKYGMPVFLKNNLLELYPELPRRQEIPWIKKEGR